MLSIFRTNQLILGLLLFAYVALLYLPSFFGPLGEASLGLGIWGNWIEGQLRPIGSEVNLIVSILLVACLGLLANLFVFTHRLAQSANLFPGVFTVLVAAMIPAFHWSVTYQLANICLAFSLIAVTGTYRTPAVADRIFNTGWWIGVAALLVPQYLFFLLVAFPGMNSLRATKFREQLILLSGVLIPLFLVGFYFYWHDSLASFINMQFVQAFALLPELKWQNLSVVVLSQHGILILLLLLTLSSYGSYNSKTTMEVRKKIGLFYWLMLGAIISMLFTPTIHIFQWQLMVLPLGILLSFNFTNWSKPLAGWLHVILFALVLAFGFLVNSTLS